MGKGICSKCEQSTKYVMNKRAIVKLVIYGLVQWVFLMLSIFVASLISGINEGVEMGMPPPLGLVVAAIIMALVSYAFCRRLKPVSRKQAIIAGLVWSGMTIVFMSITAFGNDTQGVVFGNWGMYLLLVSQLIGVMFVRIKKTDVGSPLPTV